MASFKCIIHSPIPTPYSEIFTVGNGCLEFIDLVVKEFQFRSNVTEAAGTMLNDLLKNSNISRNNQITLIGVHVRYNAFVFDNAQGYVPTDVKYLAKAIQVIKR